MKKILFLSLFLILSVFIYSCSDSGGDDGPGVPPGGGTGGEVVNPDPGGQTPDDGGQGGETSDDTPSQTGFPVTGDPSCTEDAYACGNGYNCYDYAVWPTGMDDVIVKPDNHSAANVLAVMSTNEVGIKFNEILFKNFTYNDYKAYVRKYVNMGYTILNNSPYNSIEEALSEEEPLVGIHQVDLLKNTTSSFFGSAIRHRVVITYFSEHEISNECGINKQRLSVTQSHISE